jgi:hypothetical protein
MSHILLVVFAIIFAVIAAISAAATVRERLLIGATPPGEPPPAAGTPRDRRNKWLTLTVVAALLCAVLFVALALGR